MKEVEAKTPGHLSWMQHTHADRPDDAPGQSHTLMAVAEDRDLQETSPAPSPEGLALQALSGVHMN